MFWIVGFVMLGLAGLVALIVALGAKSEDARQQSDIKAGALTVCVIVFILQIIWFGLFSIHVVDARNVGVVKTLGSISGQVGEGFQFTWPWQTVEEWNIRLQVVEPETNCTNGKPKCMDAGSIDIQDVYVEAALNMEVDVSDVQNLARNIGPRYRETIVLNRLEQVVKATISTYKADEILAKREEIRAQVRLKMSEEMAPYSIKVTDVLLTNIDFTDEFRKQIDAKTAAVQAALAAENVVKVKEAEARQREAEASGRANSLRIEAEGQAAANAVISASLTPQLIQFQAVQKLTDNIQIALVPSGSGLIFDPATLLQGTNR